MTGISRFFMLLLCVLMIMICFPDYGVAGWTFAGTIVLVWTGVILIMSIVSSLFGLYRFDGINRFLSFILFLGIMFSLLWYFPQEGNVSPINQLKYGQFPTGADLKRGLDKLTFNFAFDKRNANSEQNFINQKDSRELAQEAAKQSAQEAAKKAARKAKEKLEIVVDEQ